MQGPQTSSGFLMTLGRKHHKLGRPMSKHLFRACCAHASSYQALLAALLPTPTRQQLRWHLFQPLRQVAGERLQPSAQV